MVIITSNNEKELPDAFLRRCFFHYINFPDRETMEQIDRFFTPDSKWWDEQRPREKAQLDAYYSWPQGDSVDLFSLIFFSDSMTPPVFNRIGSRGWVPSIELTVHLRGIPVPGPVLMRGKTDFVIDGFLGEDDEIWDSEGNLVAESRQMAKLRMPK